MVKTNSLGGIIERKQSNVRMIVLEVTKCSVKFSEELKPEVRISYYSKNLIK